MYKTHSATVELEAALTGDEWFTLVLQVSLQERNIAT
jgi:hypothetical protein